MKEPLAWQDALSPGLENNHTLKCWSGIFPTILTNMIMLENGQNNILVFSCTPIQGTNLYSCWNLLKPGSQSGTNEKVFFLLHRTYIFNLISKRKCILVVIKFPYFSRNFSSQKYSFMDRLAHFQVCCATNCTSQEILCLRYAGFLESNIWEAKIHNSK